jgi:hypothetical protein
LATNDVGELLVGLKLDKILLKKELTNAEICLTNFSVSVSQNMTELGKNITQSLLTPFVQINETLSQIQTNITTAGKAISESGLVGSLGTSQSQANKQGPILGPVSDGGKIAGDLKNILELSDSLFIFSEKFKGLNKVFSKFTGIIGPNTLKVFKGIGTFFMGPWGIALGVASIAISGLALAWEEWGDDIKKLWDNIKKWFSETFGSISSKLKEFTDYISNSAKFFKDLAQDSFGGVFGGSDAKKIESASPPVVKPPPLATGISLVSEDMLAFLHKGETVLNRSESALAGAGMGGLQIQGDVVVNVPPGMSNPREMAKTMLKEMNTILKRQSGKGIGL